MRYESPNEGNIIPGIYIYINIHKSQVLFFKNLPTKGWCFICKPKKSPPLAPSAKKHLMESTPRWDPSHPGIRSRSKSVSWKQNHRNRSVIPRFDQDPTVGWKKSCSFTQTTTWKVEKLVFFLFWPEFQLPSSAGDRRISEPSTGFHWNVWPKTVIWLFFSSSAFFLCEEWLKMKWIDQKGILIQCSVFSHGFCDSIVWDKQQQQQPQ